MTSPGLWVGLAGAGAVGAVARYVVDRAVSARASGDLPRGTLVINLSGSLVLGLITGAALYHAFPSTPRVIVGTGFCGAFTTFSTFTFETVRLLEEGEVGDAAVNLVVSVVGATLAAALGIALMALV
ncbi:MAG: fluoride exporter [Actinomycetota bacterium]|nr:fluoride exporter [Actinomycetota bacterium]